MLHGSITVLSYLHEMTTSITTYDIFWGAANVCLKTKIGPVCGAFKYATVQLASAIKL